jgi:hypothetical protein
MPLSRNVVRVATSCIFSVAIFGAYSLVATPVSSAGPAPGLCHMNTSRGAVPTDFAIDACIGRAYVYLHNNLTVVLTMQLSGNGGPAKRTESDFGLAADATRSRSNDPWIFLPGDALKIPLGSGSASFRVHGSQSAGYYALALTLQTFMPGAGSAVLGAFTTLVAELDDDFVQYRDCLVGKNWIGQLGCNALQDRNIGFAFARAAVTGVASGAVGAVLAAATFTRWAEVQAPTIGTLLRSGAINISAKELTPTTTTTTTKTVATTTTSKPAARPPSPRLGSNATCAEYLSASASSQVAFVRTIVSQVDIDQNNVPYWLEGIVSICQVDQDPSETIHSALVNDGYLPFNG